MRNITHSPLLGGRVAGISLCFALNLPFAPSSLPLWWYYSPSQSRVFLCCLLTVLLWYFVYLLIQYVFIEELLYVCFVLGVMHSCENKVFIFEKIKFWRMTLWYAVYLRGTKSQRIVLKWHDVPSCYHSVHHNLILVAMQHSVHPHETHLCKNKYLRLYAV